METAYPHEPAFAEGLLVSSPRDGLGGQQLQGGLLLRRYNWDVILQQHQTRQQRSSIKRHQKYTRK